MAEPGKNVAFGLDFARQPKLPAAERRARIDQAISAVGLAHARSQYPAQLSGGMAQRTALARCLARQPEVLLLDEPFGALDEVTRADMQQLLLQLIAAHNTAAVLITHDIDEALLLSDRVLLLGDHPAHILANGTSTCRNRARSGSRSWARCESRSSRPFGGRAARLNLPLPRCLRSLPMCMDDCCSSTSRRDFLKLSAMLTAAGAVPLLSSLQARAAAEPDAPVRIGYLPITDATPLLVAHNNGLFEAEGIKAERPVLLRSWAQVIEAFISGQVNVIHLLSPMTVWARYGSKVPAKVVAWNHVGGSGLTVAPDISDIKQLGGKTVAIPFWYSIHNVVLQQMLNDNGLTPVSKPANAALAANEVNLLVLPPSDMPPALASKRIAGYIVAEPFNALAENLKVGRVQRFTGDVWRNHACCVVFMHEHDLNNRPEWSQKVVNAIVKAQQWTRDHRAEAAALLSKRAPTSTPA